MPWQQRPLHQPWLWGHQLMAAWLQQEQPLLLIDGGLPLDPVWLQRLGGDAQKLLVTRVFLLPQLPAAVNRWGRAYPRHLLLCARVETLFEAADLSLKQRQDYWQHFRASMTGLPQPVAYLARNRIYWRGCTLPLKEVT